MMKIIKINELQENQLKRIFGSTRFVYNKTLSSLLEEKMPLSIEALVDEDSFLLDSDQAALRRAYEDAIFDHNLNKKQTFRKKKFHNNYVTEVTLMKGANTEVELPIIGLVSVDGGLFSEETGVVSIAVTQEEEFYISL